MSKRLALTLAGLSLACWGAAAWFWFRAKKVQPAKTTETFECNTCAVEVPEDQVHRRISYLGDDNTILDEAGMGGRSAMIGEYCNDHCPGNCSMETHAL